LVQHGPRRCEAIEQGHPEAAGQMFSTFWSLPVEG